MFIVYMDALCYKSCLHMVLSGLKIHLNLIKISKKKNKNNEDSDKVCFLVVDGQYPEILHDFHKDLPLNSKTLRKL